MARHMAQAGSEGTARKYVDTVVTDAAGRPHDSHLPIAEEPRPAADGADSAVGADSAEFELPTTVPAPDGEPAALSGQSATSEADTTVQVGRSAALMSLLVIVSRITGFLRTWGQAAAMGVTVTASCYTVANNMPNQLYELVMGGMLATAFLPVYLSVKERAGREGANRYTSNLLSIVMLVLGVLTAVSFVFAGQVIWTQSFGATSEFDFELATWFYRFFAIEIVLYALSAVMSGVLNAERDYLWSNAAPIFNNIVCTASFVGYSVFLHSMPQLALVILALGNPLGVLIQVVMQIPSLRRHGIRLSFRIDWHDPALKETLSIGIPSLVVTIVSFITVSVQTSSALSATPAGASVTYYTRLWYTLPYAILAIPITTAMFTELSDEVSKGDMEGFRRGVSHGSSQILFFLIPMTIYLVVFAEPLIKIMAAGRFTPDEVSMTASYLAVLALALPFYGVCTYLQKACSALRRMHVFAAANVAGGVAQIVCCLWLTPVYGLNMVALSSLLIFLIDDVITLLYLRGSLGGIGMGAILGATLRSCALGAAGGAVGWGILTLLGTWLPLGGGTFEALVHTVAAGLPALLVTFGLALAFKVPESSVMRSLVGRFRR